MKQRPSGGLRRSAKRAVPDASAVAARFARELVRLRTRRGETQRQLALRLGMTESMISRLESGEHVPSLSTLCRIADGFDRRLEIVFHEHEHEHADGVRHAHGQDDAAHQYGHGDGE